MRSHGPIARTSGVLIRTRRVEDEIPRIHPRSSAVLPARKRRRTPPIRAVRRGVSRAQPQLFALRSTATTQDDRVFDEVLQEECAIGDVHSPHHRVDGKVCIHEAVMEPLRSCDRQSAHVAHMAHSETQLSVQPQVSGIDRICAQRRLAPSLQCTFSTSTRNDAAAIRTLCCIHPVRHSSRIPASTSGKPVCPRFHAVSRASFSAPSAQRRPATCARSPSVGSVGHW